MNGSQPIKVRFIIELAIIALTLAILTLAFRRASAGQWTQLYWIVTTAAPSALVFYACVRRYTRDQQGHKYYPC